MSDEKLIRRLVDYVEYEANMTRNAFATKAGIDPTNFSKMLAGKQNITTNTLKKISVAHGISMTWLLTGEGEMMESPKSQPLIGTLNGDDAKVSGRDMTINPPCTYAVDTIINEVSALRRLIEKRDEQIDKILALLDEKDKQIEKLLTIIANLQK